MPIRTLPIIVCEETHPATGQSALIYEAPAPTAFMLARAHKALTQLLGQALAPVPQIIAIQNNDDRAWLFLKRPEGQPIYRELIAGRLLSEPELLGLMCGHLNVLDSLHRAGYSGLRPGPHEIWWEPMGQQWTLLGWEWLVEGEEAAVGDLRAAAAMWIELAMGAPPGPELAPMTGPRAWRALSTGLRHLLLRLWQARSPMMGARQAYDRASELFVAWHDLEPEDLLEQARHILRKDPVWALSLFEIAGRRLEGLDDADLQAYTIAQTLVSEHVDNLLQQGQEDFLLGTYESAQYTFQKALTWPFLTPSQRASAARWLLMTESFREGAAQWSGSESAMREIVDKVILVMTLAAEGSWRKAKEQLATLRRRVHNQAELEYGFQVLDAELRAWSLWNQGLDMERKGDFGRALQRFYGVEKALNDYNLEHPHLFSPLKQDLRIVLERLEKWKTIQRIEDDAWNESQKNRYNLVAQRFREAARLAVDWPQERTRYMREAFRMEMWSQLDFYPSPPATTPWPQAWLDHIVVQLEACRTILNYFPGDAEQMSRIQEEWRKILLQIDPTHGKPLLRVLAILDRFWKRDQAIRGLVTRAVNRQTQICQQHLKELNSALLRTPTEHKEAIAQLEATHFTLQGLLAFSSPKEREKLEECRHSCKNKQNALQGRLEQISRLRVHYEQLRQGGGPALPVLEEAQRLELELFDEPTATVRRLMTLERIDTEYTQRTIRLILYRLATTALEARQPHIARSIHQFMQSADQEERFLEGAFEFIEKITEAISSESRPNESR